MRTSTVDKRTLRKLGPASRLHSDLMSYRKDVEQLAAQRQKLVKQYPGKWVAFYDGSVVARANSLDKLLQMTDAKKVPRSKVVTQHLRTEKIKMIL